MTERLEGVTQSSLRDKVKELGINLSRELPIPDKELVIDDEVLRLYVELHKNKKIRDVIEKLTGSIEIINTLRFMSAFKGTLESVVEHIGKREFIVVYPDIEGDDLKSNHWATAVALENLTTKPAKAVPVSEVFSYLKRNKKVNVIVSFDDAAFTGDQYGKMMRKIASELPNKGEYEFVVGIPYQTNAANKTIMEYTQGFDDVEVTFARHKKMATIGEIIDARYTKNDSKEVHKLIEIVWDHGERLSPLDATLVTFAHGRPDHVSFPRDLAVGNAIAYDNKLDKRWVDGGLNDDLIPNPKKPYKTTGFKKYFSELVS